jgi:ribosomal protein S18 acetylase RimI-like enzyme
MCANRKITALIQHIEDNEFALLMLSVDGQALGSCQIACWNEDQPSILGIIVDAEHRSKGHASALIQYAIEAARAEGKSALTLTVEKANAAAISLYRRMGFVTDLEDPAELWMSIQLNSPK